MKLTKHIPFLILPILGFLIYSNIINAPFIFDDNMYITDNYKIRDVSTFFKDLSGTRYIGFLTFAINYYFGGLNTFGYHIVNISIHIINAILVYILVSLTLQQLRVAGSCLILPLNVSIRGYWAYLKNADNRQATCLLQPH